MQNMLVSLMLVLQRFIINYLIFLPVYTDKGLQSHLWADSGKATEAAIIWTTSNNKPNISAFLGLLNSVKYEVQMWEREIIHSQIGFKHSLKI